MKCSACETGTCVPEIQPAPLEEGCLATCTHWACDASCECAQCDDAKLAEIWPDFVGCLSLGIPVKRAARLAIALSEMWFPDDVDDVTDRLVLFGMWRAFQRDFMGNRVATGRVSPAIGQV